PPVHLDVPRASLRVVCRAQPDSEHPACFRLAVQFLLARPRTGEKSKSIGELIELTTRAAHEQELFAPEDWEFIQWLAQSQTCRSDGQETTILSELELLQWLARWGNTRRLELGGGLGNQPLSFQGQVAELTPHLENGHQELSLTHRLHLPTNESCELSAVQFF